MIGYILCILAGMVIGAASVICWALAASGKEKDDGKSV